VQSYVLQKALSKILDVDFKLIAKSDTCIKAASFLEGTVEFKHVLSKVFECARIVGSKQTYKFKVVINGLEIGSSENEDNENVPREYNKMPDDMKNELYSAVAKRHRRMFDKDLKTTVNQRELMSHLREIERFALVKARKLLNQDIENNQVQLKSYRRPMNRSSSESLLRSEISSYNKKSLRNTKTPNMKEEDNEEWGGVHNDIRNPNKRNLKADSRSLPASLRTEIRQHYKSRKDLKEKSGYYHVMFWINLCDLALGIIEGNQ